MTNKWFRVEVTDEAGQIVAIESEMLAGRDIGVVEHGMIELAIRHLQGFIGQPAFEPKAKLPDWEAEYKKLAPVYTREGLETFIADHWPGNRLIDVIAEKSGDDHA